MYGRASESITGLAEHVSGAVKSGKKRSAIKLPLPSGFSLPLVVGVRQKLFRPTWEVAINGSEIACELCRRDVGALKSAGTSTSALAHVLRQIALIVSACECVPAASSRIDVEAETAPRPVALARHTPLRINVLSQDSSAVAAGLNSPGPTTVIKIRSASSDNSPARNTGDARVLQECAPSFAYGLASGVRVGVTLTQYVCELMARHCGESNQHGREVGGILVGYSHEVATGESNKAIETVTTDIIPVKSSDSSGAHLRLDESDWLYVQQLFDTKYTTQGKVRVGWYHTHPTQGVFFSNMDVDAHTVFRQPHQFALVIDPRQMEAGLFYWKDYASLLLAGPLRFMLVSRAGETSRVGTTAMGEPPRLLFLSPQRVVVFALAVAVAGWMLVWEASSARQLTLSQASLTALVIFAGLRLWNGGFFHPKSTDDFARGHGKTVGTRFAWETLASTTRERLKGRRVAAFAVLLLTLISLGVILYSRYYGDQPKQSQSATRSEVQPHTTSAPQMAVPGTLPPQRISLSEGLMDGREIRTLKVESSAVEVTYIALPGEDERRRWELLGQAKDEKAFLAAAFKLNLLAKQATPELKTLQVALGMAEVDGYWGQDTREALLRKAAELRGSGRVLSLNLGGRDVSIMFVRGVRQDALP
jgi:proteasome lid subunit RPN8/RPN11